VQTPATRPAFELARDFTGRGTRASNNRLSPRNSAPL